MLRPSATTTARLWRVRAFALLLLLLQGFVVAAPAFEPHDTAGGATVHVEQADARHAGPHDDGTCALCSARNLLASLPPAAAPLPPVACERHVAAGASTVSIPADIRIGNLSRAPPAHA